MMLGMSNIRDGLFFDNDREKHRLRRQIRINLPIIFAAFIPVENLEHFNRLIQGDTASDRKNVYSLVKNR